MKPESPKEIDYFFRPINLGRGAMPTPQKAIIQDGSVILVDAKSTAERRGRKASKTVYDEWQRRRKESFRRIYKAPKARLKTADKNRKIVFEFAKKTLERNPKKIYKKRELVSAVCNLCLRTFRGPIDRKTVTKYISEYLFILSS